MNPIKAAVLLAVLASSALASTPEETFNAAVGNIHESVAKIVAARAMRSQAPKAEPKVFSCTPAQAAAAYAALPVCEAAIKKDYGVDMRDSKGALYTGFSRAGVSLVLLTTTDAFFYHEDCDICAAVERCSLKDGAISNFRTAHSVRCGDLAPFLKTNVVFSSCPLVP